MIAALRRTCLVAWLVLAVQVSVVLASSGSSVASAATTSSPPVAAGLQVAEVSVAGLVDLEAPLVRLMVATKAGARLDEATLRADEKTLRESGMFRQVQAEVQPLARRRVRVLFRVEEAPPVRAVKVVGAQAIDGEALATTCRELVRGVPRPSEIAAISKRVDAAYRAAGLFACGLRAEQPLELSPEGVLSIYVSEPKLGRVWVVGNARVRQRDILRRLGLRPGVLVRQAHLDDAVKRLAKLGTIAAARFEVERFSEDEREVHLRLVVREESYFGTVELGTRFEQVNGAVASVALHQRGLFDSGWYSRLEIEAGQRQSYSLRLGSDWFLGRPVTGELGFYSLQTRREARDQGQIVSRLTERRTGQSLRLSKTLRQAARVRVGFRNEFVRGKAEDGFLLPDNLAAINGNPLRVEYPVQTLELTWTQGPEVIPLTSEAPEAWRVDLERAGGAWLNGPGDYTTLRLEGRKLFPLNTRDELAVRARVATIVLTSGTLPFLERLSAGGSETLRGLSFKSRTGDRLLLTNVEYRRRLNERLTGVLFLDWGDAWDHTQRGLDSSLSYGLGARVDISLFQLRLDFARETGEEGVKFAFGVGQLF